MKNTKILRNLRKTIERTRKYFVTYVKLMKNTQILRNLRKTNEEHENTS